MITKRPHVLRATITSAAGPYQDADGAVHVPPAATATIECPCRAEGATTDGRRTVRDGQAYDYSYTLYTGTECPQLPVGTAVEVTDRETGETFGTGRVLSHERGQRIVRTWIS